jgi:tetratricopeptide (TPR) repeat protein/3',5'-cyclic AMP phosphodiesterase CpdA
MGGLTWLHLSDWHQGNKEFNRLVVADALIKDLEERTTNISPDLAKIDFIVFSGDVAHGGKQEEYQAAKVEFFDRLLKATGLGPDRIFIIPGNHDLNRDEFYLLPPELLKPLESETDVQKWIVEERQRRVVLQPFDAFIKFVTNYAGYVNPDYATIHRIVIDGKKIALLGLNSAWMCGRNTDAKGEVDDEGYVLVGEPQIHQSLKDISDADIKIAVLHHPFEWLNEFDRRHIKEYLINECDFILNGHQHTPNARQISRNNGFYVHISTGASFLDRISKDPLLINAYNLVHLDFETKQGVVFLRRWSDRQNKWLEDTDARPPNGRVPFGLVTAYADAKPIKIEPEKKTSASSTYSVSTIIPHQIPPPPADFKGREDEINYILENFERGATITGLRGMGGIGKTALALVLAEKLKGRFPEGQIFLEMRGTSKNPDMPPVTPEEAMAHVIRAYNPVDRLPDNLNELRGLYHSILGGKQVLLLLDNAANGEQVEPLVPPANCSVLITSRIKFTLPGLVEKDLDILPSDKARELLLDIAPRIGDRADELAKLCSYLPIALRNAAKALAERRDLGVSEYEKRLGEKRARLELVKASFSLSYDLLTPGRKKQWRRLSVFPEDFDRKAAVAVLKMDPNAAFEALSDLVRWSLVDFNPFSDSEGGRYKLHDLACIFAESCLEPNELIDAQQKHSKHYLKVLSEAEELYQKGEKNLLAGLGLFDQEWANIKVGQSWTKRMVYIPRKMKNSDIKSFIQMANSYPNQGVYLLDLRLHPRVMIDWRETGLMASKIMGDRKAEGAHLRNLGLAHSNLGEIRKAIECHEQALAIDREIGARGGEGADLGNLGMAYAYLGETRKAIEYFEQALTIDREIGNRRSEGIQLGNLGSVYSGLGEPRKAIEYYKQALTINREIGDRHREGIQLGNLGSAYSELGETRKAIGYYEQALEISCEIVDKRNEGIQLGNLGSAYFDLGENGKAIEYQELALKTAQDTENQINEGESLCNLGKAYIDLNEFDRAIEYCMQSLEIVRRIEYPRIEGEALCNLGKIYTDLGEITKAIDYCDMALEIFRKMEYRRGEGDTLFNKSLALDKLGQRQEAIDHAKAALDIFEQIESFRAEKVRQKLAEWLDSGEPKTNNN